MGKENKIKKPAALLAQAKVHRRLAEIYGKRMPEFRTYWEREAETFERQAAKLMEGLPQSYLEEIEERSDEEAEKLLRAKRAKVSKKR